RKDSRRGEDGGRKRDRNLPQNARRETGSMGAASTTTHSRFLPTCGDAPKMATNGGLFQCVLLVSRFPDGHTADFGPQALRQKIPFLVPEKVWCREFRLEAVAAGCARRLKSVNVKKWNQGWARPSRSNCSDHSAGASRKVAMPMPRGSRPSTAAFTRAGAMNAIDIVMLT